MVTPKLSRREFMALAGVGMLCPAKVLAAKPDDHLRYSLVAGWGNQLLDPKLPAKTETWCYNGQVPGPLIRLKQSEILSVDFRNELEEGSAIHWHGIRIDNAMDGTVGLTQESVLPGENFHYQFVVPDAGTFWYHAHQRSSEQVGRGLYGILIVDEPLSPDVDQDILFVFDDWRLNQQGLIEPSFNNLHDIAHAGRIGNWLTVNGRGSETVRVRKGDRIRLRLANTANSLVMPLALPDWVAWVIALDGMPLQKPLRIESEISLAPGQRADLIVDVSSISDTVASINFLQRDFSIPLVYFPYSKAEARQIRQKPPNALPKNPISPASPVPDDSYLMIMKGGAMGNMTEAKLRGEVHNIQTLAKMGKVWSLNEVVDKPDTPILTIPHGSTQEIIFENQTAWPHAMHLHGHHLEVSHKMAGFQTDGEGPILRDTILVPAGKSVQARFVADNPGKWLIHCHMLEHQSGGMTTWLEVI
ncbi:MAG: multicopper oxidase family protein [Gammaproteobacteria bacterium]|nr:multicopper oxidase family protein [Gammaproteobacteria bacterium]